MPYFWVPDDFLCFDRAGLSAFERDTSIKVKEYGISYTNINGVKGFTTICRGSLIPCRAETTRGEGRYEF